MRFIVEVMGGVILLLFTGSFFIDVMNTVLTLVSSC